MTKPFDLTKPCDSRHTRRYEATERFQSEFRVTVFPDGGVRLGHETMVFPSGCFSTYQAHITPTQCRELAAHLIAAADAVEGLPVVEAA